MCVPRKEETQNVAFPEGPEPCVGFLHPRFVMRKEERKGGIKADLAESRGTSVCL